MEQFDCKLGNIRRSVAKKILCFIFLLLIIISNMFILKTNATESAINTEGSVANNISSDPEIDAESVVTTTAQTTITQEELSEKATVFVQEWLDSYTGETLVSTTNDSDGNNVNIYATKLPDSQMYGNERIFYSSSGFFVYEYTDESGKSYQKQFTVGVASSEGAVGLDEVNASTYGEYATGLTFIEREESNDVNGVYMLLNSEKGDLENSSAILYVKIGDEETFLTSGTPQELQMSEIEQSFLANAWEVIAGAGTWIVQQAIDKLGKIINEFLLGVGDNLQRMIDMIMKNEKTTVYTVIFGKLPQLSINFWEASSVEISNDDPDDASTIDMDIDTPPAAVLKPIVSYWYKILRRIAISIYLIMLLYIGVKILMADTGASANKAKEMLTSWLVGIIILSLFPVAMRCIVEINQSLVSELDPGAASSSAGNSDDAMIALRNMAEERENLALTIVYIIMLGQVVILLGMYYKRVLVISFLIVIFPIVAALHIWQKANRGGRTLGTWTKEFTILVITQSFHAVIYVVLIDGAYRAFLGSDGNNWLMFLFSVLFLFQAEKIIRAIFGMRSSANTIGDLATAGTAAWATAKAYGSIFKRDKKSGSSDEDDLDDANDSVNAARTNQNIKNTVASTVANSGMHDDNDRDGNASNNLDTEADKPMDNLDAAKAFMTQQGLQGKTKKNMITKALSAAGKTAVSGTARAAGITLGITSGLAAGSLQEGIKNAVIFNEITGAAAKGVNYIVGYAHGAFAGQVMKMKVRSGAMDDKLREIGFDFEGEFDPDPVISSKKAEIIREALAQQISGTRRSGKQTGEYQLIKSVDKQRRRNKR